MCIRISTISSRKLLLHGHRKRIWHERGKHKWLCFEDPLRYLWTKSGWKGLESITCWQNRQGTKFCTFQTWKRRVLSRSDNICTIYRWLDIGRTQKSEIDHVTCLKFASRIGFNRKVSCLTYFYLTRFPTAKSEFQTRFKIRSRYSHTPPETAVILNRERINNLLRSIYVVFNWNPNTITNP